MIIHDSTEENEIVKILNIDPYKFFIINNLHSYFIYNEGLEMQEFYTLKFF